MTFRNLTTILLALAMAGMASAQTNNTPLAEAQLPAPRLQFVFEEFVTLAPSMHPGATPYGERNIVPITGGTFSGPKMHGKVLPGGWDWQLATKTGCHSLDANYMIQTEDGAIINVINQGAVCASAGKDAKIFTTPRFEAPLGPYEWLNGGAYIGTLDPATIDGKPAVHLRFYRAE